MKSLVFGMMFSLLRIFCLSCSLLWHMSSSALQAGERQSLPQHAAWEPAIVRFEQADAEQGYLTGGNLFVGSSTIVRWKLAEHYPDFTVLNRGFGGSLLSDTVFFFERIVARHHPDVIVVYAGYSDLGRGGTPHDVVHLFRQLLVKREQFAPTAKLVYIGINISPKIRQAKLVGAVRSANSQIQQLCEQGSNCVFVNLEIPEMVNADGSPRRELFVEDQVHLSPQGYEILSRLVRPHLADKKQSESPTE